MSRFPRDRFDDVADGPRVGAHRGVPRRGRGWIAFAWAALATGVLVGLGVLLLTVLNGSSSFTSPHASASASAGPSSAASPSTAAPSASASGSSGSGSSGSRPTGSASVATPAQQTSATTLTVLNGTTKAGLAATGTATLENAGWQVASDGNAGSTDATTTIVYYQTAEQAAIARGIVGTLGVGSVARSSAFPNSAVTVVLGADYAG